MRSNHCRIRRGVGRLAGLLLALCAAIRTRADNVLRIYWMDVEGGAATLVVTPAGESVLIDTGTSGRRDARRIVRLALDVARVQTIDHLVVTHSDTDHYGGASEISERLPVGSLYEPRDAHRDVPPSDPYGAWRTRQSLVRLAPGDAIPLRQRDNLHPLTLQCLAAGGRVIAPPPNAPPNPLAAGDHNEYPEDRSRNADSIVLLLRFGAFTFYAGGDLTGRLERQLVDPVNLVGTVDVYQVSHHGLDLSNHPLLVKSLAPTVTVMSNGPHKGCEPRTRALLRAVESIEANYQLHKNLEPGSDNTSEEFIANTGDSENCAGHWIELHVKPDSRSYTVRIPATGHARDFVTRNAIPVSAGDGLHTSSPPPPPPR